MFASTKAARKSTNILLESFQSTKIVILVSTMKKKRIQRYMGTTGNFQTTWLKNKNQLGSRMLPVPVATGADGPLRAGLLFVADARRRHSFDVSVNVKRGFVVLGAVCARSRGIAEGMHHTSK